MIFINIIYQQNVQILQIKESNENINYDDLCNAVKELFQLKNEVKFYDTDTRINIPSNILAEYVLDKKITSPKWILGVSEKTEKLNILAIDEDISNSLIVEDIVDISEATLTNVVDEASCEINQIYRTISLHNSQEFIENENVNPIVKGIFPSYEAITEIKDLDFVIIYANFIKTKTLENCDRTQIAKLILKPLLQQQHNLELTRIDFIYLSRRICECFQKEITSTYYNAGCRAQKPSGKLYDSYCFYRKKLSCCGLITRRHRTSVEQTTVVLQPTDSSVLEDFEFVKKNFDSWDELVPKWRNSYSERSKLLKDSKISTLQYIENFPILRECNETQLTELLKIDAELACPAAQISNIAVKWEIYYKKIILLAKKSTDFSVKSLCALVDTCTDETNKKSLAFVLLTYIFPYSRTTKRTIHQNSFKITKIESQENFVAYFKTIQEAEDFEQRLLNKKKGLQPRVVIIGDITSQLVAYVTLIDKKFKFDEVKQAVQTCFYMFYALDIAYPVESVYIWTFMQLKIFGIHFSNNNKSLPTISIVESINNDLLNI